MNEDAKTAVCSEILEIMKEYDRQIEARGYVDTPGGIENAGDTFKLFCRWRNALTQSV